VPGCATGQTSLGWNVLPNTKLKFLMINLCMLRIGGLQVREMFVF
jgi:hypothetical protein